MSDSAGDTSSSHKRLRRDFFHFGEAETEGAASAPAATAAPALVSKEDDDGGPAGSAGSADFAGSAGRTGPTCLNIQFVLCKGGCLGTPGTQAGTVPVHTNLSEFLDECGVEVKDDFMVAPVAKCTCKDRPVCVKPTGPGPDRITALRLHRSEHEVLALVHEVLMKMATEGVVCECECGGGPRVVTFYCFAEEQIRGVANRLEVAMAEHSHLLHRCDLSVAMAALHAYLAERNCPACDPDPVFVTSMLREYMKKRMKHCRTDEHGVPYPWAYGVVNIVAVPESMSESML